MRVSQLEAQQQQKENDLLRMRDDMQRAAEQRQAAEGEIDRCVGFVGFVGVWCFGVLCASCAWPPPPSLSPHSADASFLLSQV